MEIDSKKRALAKQLQAKINAMQGLGKLSDQPSDAGLLPFSNAFPNHIFPKNAIHEFVSYASTDAASTNAFIAALTGKFLKEGDLCLWIANQTKIFPAGLKHFGLDPDRIIFIDSAKPKETLWIIEEALKCEALKAVVGEIKELSFTESRRLQLAVEHSNVTGFIHRHQPYTKQALACTARWQITPLPSQTLDRLPGIGHSHWQVELLKIKNGMPHGWNVSWTGGYFIPTETHQTHSQPERHAG